MALLLSSVGLAAGLLVGTPLGDGSLPRSAWKPSLALTQVTNGLTSQQRAAKQTMSASLSSLAPAYGFVASAEFGAPLPSPASYQPLGQPLAAEATSAPIASTLRATVQQSWRTFKLAFR